MTYSRFIDGLSKSGITVDRKVLSDLAITEPQRSRRSPRRPRPRWRLKGTGNLRASYFCILCA